jgi:hypothetical protein
MSTQSFTSQQCRIRGLRVTGGQDDQTFRLLPRTEPSMKARVGKSWGFLGVKAFLLGILIGLPLLAGSGAMACEKHLHGHQSGAETTQR